MKRTTVIIGPVSAVALVLVAAFVGWIGQQPPSGRADPTNFHQVALGERV